MLPQKELLALVTAEIITAGDTEVCMRLVNDCTGNSGIPGTFIA